MPRLRAKGVIHPNSRGLAKLCKQMLVSRKRLAVEVSGSSTGGSPDLCRLRWLPQFWLRASLALQSIHMGTGWEEKKMWHHTHTQGSSKYKPLYRSGFNYPIMSLGQTKQWGDCYFLLLAVLSFSERISSEFCAQDLQINPVFISELPVTKQSNLDSEIMSWGKACSSLCGTCCLMSNNCNIIEQWWRVAVEPMVASVTCKDKALYASSCFPPRSGP